VVVLAILIGCVAAGSAVYCLLTVIAARKYLAIRVNPLPDPPPLSVLKPLSGAEDDLYSNLRTFFEQDYPDFEILFAVRAPSDPAVPVVERLRAHFPRVPVRMIITGEPPYPNAKVFSLDRMMAAAKHELLVMSDSDIRVTSDFLRVIAAEFRDQRVGLSTCPYRAVPGRGIWALLEAIGMNTQFLGGVLTARMLEGMRFALGPTIIARKSVLVEMGGFDRLKDFLAEDFVMGKFAAENGHTVILSSYVIEHHIGGGSWRKNLTHRLRWVRSTRRSRPAGYIGEMFTMPMPWVLTMLFVWWPGALILLALRVLSAVACAGWVLHDRLTAHKWYLLPVQDLLAFAMWVAGFFGNTILWRGRRYALKRDGTFELIRR
jgi:ceramide glucosyltransferase